MKNARYKLIGIIFVLCFSIGIILGIMFNNDVSSVAEAFEDIQTIQDISEGLFGKIEIEKCEYLYGLDGNEDFIYISYKEKGYAILYKSTLELMEYSLQGELPYKDYIGKKYYGGPNSYLLKEDGQFKNISTGEVIKLSEKQGNDLAQSIKTVFSKEGQESIVNLDYTLSNSAKSSSPAIDGENPIIPSTMTGCISNYKYFTSYPSHTVNTDDSCGSVAAQLLLSYHNYYTDRRIIAPEYLNGWWKDDNDGDIYNPANYYYPEKNVNACENPDAFSYKDEIRSYILGSAGNYKDYIKECVKPKFKPTFPSELINGIKLILNQRVDKNEFEVYGGSVLGSFGNDGSLSIGSVKTQISAEIRADRPVLIAMLGMFGAEDHWVVGYGEQSYKYPNSSKRYSGYIAHFGRSNVPTNIWINSDWCAGYVAVNFNHKHNHNIETDNNALHEFKELRCGECGHRTVDTLFTTDKSGTVITGAKYKLPERIDIPNSINNIQITGIGDGAFKNNSDVKAVDFYFATKVKSIGKEAFAYCRNLTRINEMPREVTSISDNTFEGCTSLEYIYLPKSLKKIGEFAFAFTAIESITLPETVTSIGAAAFTFCNSLTDIVVPDSVTFLGNIVFLSCNKLKSVTLSKNISKIPKQAFYNCENLESIELPEGITEIGEGAFSACKNLKSINVPNSVSFLEFDMFNGCESLTEITLPFIGESATSENSFFGYIFGASKYSDQNMCIPKSLKTVILNNGDKISDNAFYGCNRINEINLPNSIKQIGSAAFYECTNLKSVKLVYGLTAIGNFAFYNCTSLEEISLPNTITTVGAKAFYNCDAITTLNIPAQLNSIGESAFSSCGNLESITVNQANKAFEGKNNCIIRKSDRALILGCQNSVIPNGIKTIAQNAFINSGIAGKINIPEGVERIEEGAFCGCDKITQVILPDSLTTIGYEAFNYCIELKDITIPANISVINAFAFKNCTNLAAVNFKKDCKLTEIRTGAFTSCKNLMRIVIPASVKIIGNNAFEDCVKLYEIEFEENSGLESIGIGAFCYTNIEQITIPSKVEVINNFAFAGCESLKTVLIEGNSSEDVIEVGTQIFDECYNLNRIAVPYKLLYYLNSNLYEYSEKIYCLSFKATIFTDYEEDYYNIAPLNRFQTVYIINYDNCFSFADIFREVLYSENCLSFYITNAENVELPYYALEYAGLDSTDDVYVAGYGINYLNTDSQNDGIKYIINDYYSEGFNIASEFLSSLTSEPDYVIEQVQLFCNDLGYFPIITTEFYQCNINFLMGMSDVLGVPVKVVNSLSEINELYYQDFNYWVIVSYDNFIDECLYEISNNFTNPSNGYSCYYLFDIPKEVLNEFDLFNAHAYNVKNKVDYIQEFNLHYTMDKELMFDEWEFYYSGSDNSEAFISFWIDNNYQLDYDSWECYLSNRESCCYIEMIVQRV